MHGVLLQTAPNSTTQWAALVIGLLTLIYITFVRPLKKGKKKDPLARSPTEASLAQQRAMERDMSALLVDYEQMMRRMTSQLETRVAKLELLLSDADARIVTLQKLLAEAQHAVSLPVLLQPPHQPPAGQSDNFTPVTVKRPPVALIPASHQVIYDLADQGFEGSRIARQLDRPVGEVELILALRSRAAAAANSDDDEGGDEAEPDGGRPATGPRENAVVADESEASESLVDDLHEGSVDEQDAMEPAAVAPPSDSSSSQASRPHRKPHKRRRR